MSTPKPAKATSYSVKFSNKTGGAYADMKAIIESEVRNWRSKANGADQADACKNTNGNSPKKDSSKQ